MSTLYAGADSFPANITIPADNDPAAAAAWNAALEGNRDALVWLRKRLGTRPYLYVLGSLPFVKTGGAGSVSIDTNYMNLVTAGSAGTSFRVVLPRLIEGLTVTGIDILIIPKTTARAGWPLGSAPQASLLSGNFAAGVTPGAPSTLASGTYTPVSQADYQNGQIKKWSLLTGFTVDGEDNVYLLDITDESGANAIPGSSFLSIAINYA